MEFVTPLALSAFVIDSIISNPPGVRMIAYEIQKPPKDESAVAPKVLPTAISLEKKSAFPSNGKAEKGI